MNFIYQHVNRTPVTTGVLKDYGLLSTNLASGTLVKEGKFQSKKISVEVGNLKKGTYYLRVTVKDTFFTERIVVE